jgi:hypothetical protein
VEGDPGLLRLRVVALAIWCACVMLIVVPAVTGSARAPGDSPFQQPVEAPVPHLGYPVNE